MSDTSESKQAKEAGATADVIVIGSGFGGAVAADRLVRAGLRVRLLERGPWRRTAPVAASPVTRTQPLPIQHRPGLILRSLRRNGGRGEIRLNRNGLLELHLGEGVKTLAASAVGGGSHLWAALTARPDDPGYWNGRADGLSETLMAPHYEQVAAELGAVHPTHVERIPNHTSHAWQGSGWFDNLGPAAQWPFAFLFPEANGGRVSAGRRLSELSGEDGLFGSAGGSKANVEVIYLLPHLDRGLTVHDLHEATLIRRTAGGSYLVTAQNHHNAERVTFSAPRVVLAAGTMNSLRLLFASQEAGGIVPSGRLGRGFGTNGDCMGTWQPDVGGRSSRLGTPVHGRLRCLDHPPGVNLIVGGLDAVPLPHWIPQFLRQRLQAAAARRFQLIAMGVDQADGSVAFSQGRLRLAYDLRNSPVYQAIFDLFDSLSEQSGHAVKFDRKCAVTAHAMGGCRIGASPSQGVVDGSGQIYGNPGLYVADASALPAPTGGPPSLSIAAWSAHVAACLLNQLPQSTQ